MRSARFLVRLAGIGYLVALLVLAALVYGPGERFWPVTFFLFGPRWVLALPLVLLLPAAVVADRRLAAALVVVPALLAEPLLGFAVPWGRLAASGGSAPLLRVATWNAGGGADAARAIGLLLEREAPDVVVVQEAGPDELPAPSGWHRHVEAGMAVLTRFPVLEVAARDQEDMWRLAGSGAIVRYGLETPLGRVDLTSVHLETPREGIEAILRFGPGAAAELVAKNEQRDIEARLARRWVDGSTASLRLVAGDFNTPVESNLFREYWSGFTDCHSAVGAGFGFTKRTRRIGARIDHVLAGPGLECVSTQVGVRFSGDHAPLVAELRLGP